jgi:chromosome transmission fidelity protein 1
MSRSSLHTPSSFPAFPFDPYQIQLGFMQELYRCLEDGCVGLLESPTGTGKTISIICSSLQWLLDDRQRQERDEADAKQKEKEEKSKPTKTTADDDDLPDWLLQPEATVNMSEGSKRKAGSESDRSAVARSRLKSKGSEVGSAHLQHSSRSKASLNTLGGSKLNRLGSKQDAGKKNEMEEFALTDDDKENSSGEGGFGGKRKAKRHDDSSDDEEGEEGKGAAMLEKKIDLDPKPYKTQIFFCSRTHSQLSQFVGELRRTNLPDSLSIIALAGRKVLCINEEIIKAGPASLINERCLEMQQSKNSSTKKQNQGIVGGDKPKPSSKRSSKCPYLQPINQGREGDQGSEVWEGFVDRALGQPLDVEDLLALGESKGVCPYYGSRRMVEEADLIMLPYSSLLSEEARDSLGITLDGNIVIFDESHNLVDAVNACHSVSIDLSQLRGAARQVRAYFERFSSRLGAANAQRVQLLLRVLETLSKYLSLPQTIPPSDPAAPPPGSEEGAGRVMTANDFLFDLSLDSINLVGLLGWVKESKMLQKCAGYAQTQEVSSDPTSHQQGRGSGSRAERLSSLHASTSFLSALTNPDADGRVVVMRHSTGHPGELKYLLLNAAAHFSRVLLKARSVILASGTLSPIQGLLQQLFPSHRLVQSSSAFEPPLPFPTASMQIARHYECQHVIPNESLVAMVVGKGPSGVQLALRHSERSKPEVMDEIGRLLCNLGNIVPHGLIAFLPSFSQMEALINRWKSTGAFAQMGAKKKIFVEPRSASEIDAVLADYATTIKECKAMNLTGALLLSVVGAKLSEGINFGDELGRCVVVVGMPYPNPSDPELKERMAFIDKAARISRLQGGPVYSSQQYYEDLCMKAVNQSIGRVIRHKSDHAAVILADQRYLSGGGGARPLDKLPKWMRPSLVDQPMEFGQVVGRLCKFFKSKHSSAGNV